MSHHAEHLIIEESEQLLSEVGCVARNLETVLGGKNSEPRNQEYFHGCNFNEIAAATDALQQIVSSLENSSGKMDLSQNIPSWMQKTTVSNLQSEKLEESELSQQSLFSVAAQAA